MLNKTKIITAALAACLSITAISGCGKEPEITEAQSSIAVSMENVDVLQTVLSAETTTTPPDDEDETTVSEVTTTPETSKAITSTTVKMPSFTGVKVSVDTTGADEEAIKALEAAKKGAEAIANNNLEDMLKWVYFPVYVELCSAGTMLTHDTEKIKEWFDVDIEEGRSLDEAWAQNYAMYQDLQFYNPVKLTEQEVKDLKSIFCENKLVGEPKSIERNGYAYYEYAPEDKQRIYKVNVLGESINSIYVTNETPYMYVVGHSEYNEETDSYEVQYKLDALMVYLEQSYNKIDELPTFEGRFKDGDWNEGGDKDNITDYIFIPFKDVFYKRQKPAETKTPDTTAPAETTNIE